MQSIDYPPKNNNFTVQSMGSILFKKTLDDLGTSFDIIIFLLVFPLTIKVSLKQKMFTKTRYRVKIFTYYKNVIFLLLKLVKGNILNLGGMNDEF